jgi:hypothetical protein
VQVAGLRGTSQTTWLTSTGQIDFYDEPALIAQATDLIDAFFRRVLAPAKKSRPIIPTTDVGEWSTGTET